MIVFTRDMFGAGELLLDAGHAVPAAHAPRCSEFGVEEDGAFKPNRLENAGQGIHGVKEMMPAIARVACACASMDDCAGECVGMAAEASEKAHYWTAYEESSWS
jgi:hypothetical protein